MLKILHKHNPFERIRDPDNCDFCEGFSLDHVIITMIIRFASKATEFLKKFNMFASANI